MLIINIDRTVETLLNKYVQHCARVLENKRKSFAKMKNVTDLERELDAYNESLKSYEFLKKVAKNPKAYLYSGQDIFYTELQNGESLYSKLQYVINNDFGNGTSLLVRLCEAIAHHVSNPFENKGDWEYWSGKCDMDAEQILKINKIVNLLDANDFAKSLKDILPVRAFVPREAKVK